MKVKDIFYSEVQFEKSFAFIPAYFKLVWKLTWQPAKFFSTLLESPRSLSIPLSFALVTHWIGSALEFLWRSALGELLRDQTQTLTSHFRTLWKDLGGQAPIAPIIELRDQLSHWTFGAGSILLDPFKTLIKIALVSSLVWIGARILIYSRAVKFESIVQVVCYSFAPMWLLGVPLAGSFLAPMACFLVLWVGLREVFSLSWVKSLLISLTPQILLFIFFVGSIVALMVLTLKAISLLFS